MSIGTVGAMAMSVLVTLLFAALLIMLFYLPPLGPVAEKAFYTMLGSVATAWTMSVQFWLGSSAGSAAKSETIAEFMKMMGKGEAQ